MKIFDKSKYDIDAELAGKIAADVQAAHDKVLKAEQESNNSKLKELNNELAATQSKLEDSVKRNESLIDMTPDEIEALKKQATDAELLKQQIKGHYESKLNEVTDELNAAKQQLQQYVTKQRIKSIIDEYSNKFPDEWGLKTGALELLTPIIESRMSETDGGLMFSTKDGKPVIDIDGIGDGAAFIKSFRDEYPLCFEKPQGANSAGSGVNASKPFNEMTEQERVALFQSNPSAYEAAKKM